MCLFKIKSVKSWSNLLIIFFACGVIFIDKNVDRNTEASKRCTNQIFIVVFLSHLWSYPGKLGFPYISSLFLPFASWSFWLVPSFQGGGSWLIQACQRGQRKEGGGCVWMHKSSKWMQRAPFCWDPDGQWMATLLPGCILGFFHAACICSLI